jgi:pimeloyl-ACP methyl ester carboxylesterase
MARIVLVHGAFGSASVWGRVVPGLRAAGHEVEAVNLPGVGDDPTSVGAVTLDACAREVCAVLAQGPPAMLVAHSMGGVVVTQAAARCPEHVAGLVYVCAFVPADGQSLAALTQLTEAAGDAVQANMVVAGDPPVATMPAEAAPDALMGCCDEEGVAWGIARLRAQAVGPFIDPVSVDGPGAAAFAGLPRAYVMCRQDRAIMPALQRRMLEVAGCDPVIELDTDHMPQISRVDELVGVLDELVRGVAGPH